MSYADPSPDSASEKISPAAVDQIPKFKIMDFDCVCGQHTDLTGAGKFVCFGCGRELEIQCNPVELSPEVRYANAMAELENWISVLHNAPRTGADKDDPEGSRTVTISDTLASNMCDCLRELRDTALKGMSYVHPR